MKTYAPQYYKKFKCIADKCRHSCCVGWEVDIDEKTLQFYSNVQGEFGKRLAENISHEDVPHFILDKNERCPFLNSCGLCDIYTTLGEKHLSHICTEHPRFHNFFDERTETGIGLCCEEAARIILSEKDKFTIVVDGEKPQRDEKGFFALRQKAFDIVSDEDMAFGDRITSLSDAFGLEIPQKSFGEWVDFYLSLEILDGEWEKLLLSVRDENPVADYSGYEKQAENLLTYFLFRHLRCDDLSPRLAFCIVSTKMIFDIFSLCKEESFETLCDIARMYSSEIEYSEDNTDELLFELSI